MQVMLHLKGTTPLLMHNPRMVDPEYEITRELKSITSKRKKTDEDLRRVETLEWFGGLYTDGDPPQITQPSSKVRKCLINTGKISKLGKAVERALTMTTINVPLEYDGPSKPEEVFHDLKFHSRLSVGMNGTKRIMRVRPQFFPWSLTVPAIFIEDAGLNYDELERLIALGGQVEGIGDARAIGYGRFTGTIEAQ